jgi:glyoxylase-like metal-dependent hydrolase (beta-lactamase superfamily II)
MPHEPFTLGSVEIVPLCDGWAPLPLSDEMPGGDVDWDDEGARHPWAFPPGDASTWAWHVHSFLLRHPDGLALIDTGIGHFGRPPYDVSSAIDEELDAVGVSPADVGHIVLTHLHADHAGGACRPDGSPRFPNARHHVHPDDWSFFAEQRTPDDFTGRFAMAEMEELGMLDLDATDREVLRGVRLRHAPGHTPGHRVVQLDDGNDTLLMTGDLLHVPPQIAFPALPSNHDEDPELAARQRAEFIEAARMKKWALGVSHFARPFGRVGSDGWASI